MFNVYCTVPSLSAAAAPRDLLEASRPSVSGLSRWIPWLCGSSSHLMVTASTSLLDVMVLHFAFWICNGA